MAAGGKGPFDVAQEPVPAPQSRRVAIIPSTDVFEDHFGRGLGLDRSELGTKYRNDFLFLYSGILSRRGWAVDLVLLSTSVQEVERHSYPQAPDVVYVPLPSLARPLLRLRRGPLRYLVSFLLTWIGLRGRTGQYDSLYCQEFCSGRYLALALLARRSRTPLVGAHHGGSLSTAAARLLRLAAPLRDRLLLTTLTRQETEHTRGLLGSSADVVHLPNPVEDSFLQVADAPQRRGTVFLGRLFDDQKRLSDLLCAVSELDPALWAPLTVVGDGPDRAAMETFAHSLGIQQHVRFLGFVYDREQIKALLGASSWHAMPSAFEGAPLAVLETQAAGVLPLVTDLAAFRECLPPGTAVTAVGDVDALRAAVVDAGALPEDELATRRQAHRAFVRDTFSEDVAGSALDGLLSRR